MKLNAVLYSAAAFMITCGIASADRLSTFECRLVKNFQSASGMGFARYFSEMVHYREFCLHIGAGCEVPLQKRMDNFCLAIPKVRELGQDEVKIIDEALADTLGLVAATTGMTPYSDDSSPAENFILMQFLSGKGLQEDRSEYYHAAERVTHLFKSEDTVEQVKDLFFKFIHSDLPCLTFSQIHEDGIIRDSFIWIKHDQGESLLRRCIAEEVHNSFGFSEPDEYPSMFDIPYLRYETSDRLSELDVFMLRILSLDDLSPNSTMQETSRVVAEIINRDCQRR